MTDLHCAEGDHDSMQNLKIIAEIGVNHNGSVAKAFKLVDAAIESGATAVKFQSFKTEKLANKNTPKVQYQKRDKSTQTHFDMLKQLELSISEQTQLFNYCNHRGIEFISTPYDIDSADQLLKMGVGTLKIASADIIDKPLLDFISSSGKKTIISTGMATLDEVDKAISCFDGSNCKLSLLHCVSNYPCSEDSLNLSVIDTLRNRYNLEVGFSDHAESHMPSQLALAVGCNIFERHFTLDRTANGPDHYASDEPREFKHYVEGLHRAAQIMGSSDKRPQPEELDMRLVSRKGMYWASDKLAGEKITLSDLQILRPSTTISPMDINDILDKTLIRDVSRDNPVDWTEFC